MKKLAGFTLIEMVMVIAIIGVLAAAVSPIAIESMQSYDAASTTAVTLDKLRYASERMEYEIREMSSGSINTMSSTALTFNHNDYTSTISSSPIIVSIAQSSDGNNVTLTYSSQPVTGYTPVLTDQLYKGTTSSPVNGLAFSYYDTSYAVTTTPANVRYVGIDLTLAATVAGSSQTYSQHTLVALRNQ